MTVQIQNYQEAPYNPSSSLVGTFNVYLPNIQLLIRHVKVLRGKNGHFISMPTKMFEEDGKKVFVPYLEFSKEREKRLKEMITEALKPFVVKAPEPSPMQDLFDHTPTDADCPF